MGAPGHTERGKQKGMNQNHLSLLTGTPGPAPAIPTMRILPQLRAGLGTHSFCRMQRAQPAWDCPLEGKTTSKSGHKCEGKDTNLGGIVEIPSCGFLLSPFDLNPLVAPLKPAPIWGFRAGSELDAPGALPNSWGMRPAQHFSPRFYILNERFHGNSCTSFMI